MNLWSAVGLGVLLALAACGRGKALAELIETRRPAVEARIAQIEQLKAALDTMPELARDAIVLGDRPPIVRDHHQRNYIIYNVEDLIGDLSRMPTAAGSEVSSSDVVASVLRALRDGTTRHHGYDDELDRMAREFDHLERTRYALVVDTESASEAEAFGRTFAGGAFRGQVHAWDLEDAVWLGGYALHVRDERESTTVRSDRNASATIAGDFRHMLNRAFYEGLDRALEASQPGPAE